MATSDDKPVWAPVNLSLLKLGTHFWPCYGPALPHWSQFEALDSPMPLPGPAFLDTSGGMPKECANDSKTFFTV